MAAGAEGAAADAAKEETGTTPAGSGAAAEPPAVEDKVGRAEYEQLKAERDQLLDRLARLQAEFENARKRAERERAEYRDFAAGSIVEQFLPVLDNFELALKASGFDRAIALRRGTDRQADGGRSAPDAGDARTHSGRTV